LPESLSTKQQQTEIAVSRQTASLGPEGRNVVRDKSYGAPRITKDGVTRWRLNSRRRAIHSPPCPLAAAWASDNRYRMEKI
jgi:hypothetical protein